MMRFLLWIRQLFIPNLCWGDGHVWMSRWHDFRMVDGKKEIEVVKTCQRCFIIEREWI